MGAEAVAAGNKVVEEEELVEAEAEASDLLLEWAVPSWKRGEERWEE